VSISSYGRFEMRKAKLLSVFVLLALLLSAGPGVTLAQEPPPPQAAQPTPPIADLMLRDSDLSGYGFGCEQVRQDGERRASEMAEFVGLSPDYLEGDSVYFVVYSPPEPKAVIHGLYRYDSEKEAIAHYEHLLEAFPLTPLGHETPIISISERSLKGVEGQMIETQDPIGTAYWFVGVRGKLLTVMAVLGAETTGQPVLEEQLPIALERIAGSW
jgi:hypothetical protein